MTGISNDVSYSLRRDISSKINRIPLKYFESRTYGEVSLRITNDVDTLQQSLNQEHYPADHIGYDPGRSVLYDAVYQCVDDAGCAFDSSCVHDDHRTGDETFPEIFPGAAELPGRGGGNGQVEEVYSGHNIIKAFNKEEDVEKTFQDTNEKLYTSAWKSQFFSGMMMPIMQFVGNLGM